MRQMIFLKIRRDDFFALFDLILEVNRKATEGFQKKELTCNLEELVLYDFGQKINTTTNYHSWQDRQGGDKLYSFKMPVSVAVALVRLLMPMEVGHPCRSLMGNLNHRMLQIMNAKSIFNGEGAKAENRLLEV